MSAPPTIAAPSRKLKWVLVFMIVILVPALQVGLPWLSCYLASDSEDADRAAMGLSDQRSFWALRFSFDRFLHPCPVAEYRYAQPDSPATVCRDEFIILQPHGPYESRTIECINLRTGRMTTSKSSAGVVDVLSDGDKLWFLDDRNPADEASDAFVYQGRVARLRKLEPGPDVNTLMTYELEYFESDEWRPTGQFALVPNNLLIKFDTDLHTGTICCFDENDLGRTLYYSLKLRNKDEHVHELHRYIGSKQTAVLKPLQEIEWSEVPEHPFNVSHWCWSENDVISVVQLYLDSDHLRFLWSRGSNIDGPRERLLMWPVYPVYYSRDEVRLVRSSNQLYFVASDPMDGRWTICRWEDGRLVLLVNQHSPLLGITCLDAMLFATFAFVIPSIALAFIASTMQRLFPTRFELTPEVTLASFERRRTARTIDLMIAGTPLLLSVVLHPNTVAWWENLKYAVSTLWAEFWFNASRFVNTPDWGTVSNFRSEINMIAGAFVSVPILPQLAALAFVLLVAQLVWQCRSGQSLGKWIMGIRFVRTDLKRCDWSRCLVREALLLVDGLLFLSWVPGVICMLITSKSQRIGDRFSDTIVVRNSHPSSSASMKSS